MSKQSDAKAHQKYTTAVSNCGNCKHLKFDLTLPAWMAERNCHMNNAGQPSVYTLERHAVEKGHRCALGEFAIKKLASCKLHDTKVAA